MKGKNEAALSEIARLKRYVEELEREREKDATEQAKLQDKIAELKLIVQTYLHSKSTKEVSERQENNAENLKPVKMKVWFIIFYCVNSFIYYYRNQFLFHHLNWDLCKVHHLMIISV